MVLPPTQELGGMDPISNRDNLNATGNLLKQKPFGENRQSVGALSASQSQQQ